MPTPSTARTTSQRAGSDRAEQIRRDLAGAIRRAREDAGVSQRAVASAAGISNATLHNLEHGAVEPSLEVIARIAAVLGGRLVTYIHVGTGPLIRDHLQTPMIGALASSRSDRWRIRMEVGVEEPVTGVIDAVLVDRDGLQVACEAHSRLRRVEQQVRWATAKTDALATSQAAGGREVTTSRLLLLYSSPVNRAVAAEYTDYLAAAYPARAADAHASLTGDAPWPGPAILWCRVEGTRAQILATPPRGIRLGR